MTHGSLLVEEHIEPLPTTEQQIGLDVGLKSFVVTSEGEAIANPKYYARDEKRLAKAQRQHAKKKKGSKNREKARKKVARLHAKIVDKRRDYQHKLSTRIIRENQTVCIESLNIKGMVQNHLKQEIPPCERGDPPPSGMGRMSIVIVEQQQQTGITMAESTTQPEINHSETYITTEHEGATTERGSTQPVIWTPFFIALFALLLALGLSAESLFTQGWLNGMYRGGWVLLGHVIVILGAWIAMCIVTRSSWMRIGSIFGCLWAIFSIINLVISLHPIDPTSPIIAHLSAASSSAFLGAYICLATERSLAPRWDAWFFGLALIGSIIAVGGFFFFTPANSRSAGTIEGSIVAIAQVLSILVWWGRPSTWKALPGPTLLFGLAPAMLLLLSIPNLANTSTNFFISQLALLCILLATLRTLQAEWLATH